MNRNRSIDYLKAFAILMVVFYHAIISLDICYHDLTYICVTIALQNVHVPLFLLIAGYLCRKQDIRSFYLKKVRRILIPFLFMTVLKLILNNILSTSYIHGNSVGMQLFDAFICGQLYWFCYALLIMFAAAPLLWDRKALKWVLLVLLIGANLILVLKGIHLTDILQIHNVLYYCPFFLIGMLLKDYRMGEWTIKAHLLWLAAALLVGAVTGYLRFHEDVNNIYAVDLFMGLCIMYLLYMIAELIPKKGLPDKWLVTAGTYSLQIMLLDPFLRTVLSKLFLSFMEKGTLMAVIITLLNAAICCLICIVAEKIPVISVLMGLEPIKRN